MADRTRSVFDQSANARIKVKYKDMANGSYAREYLDCGSVSGLPTNNVNIFDESANASVPIRYYITADSSQARSVRGS